MWRSSAVLPLVLINDRFPVCRAHTIDPIRTFAAPDLFRLVQPFEWLGERVLLGQSCRLTLSYCAAALRLRTDVLHLPPVSNGASLLYSAVMPSTDDFFAMVDYRSDRNSAFPAPLLGFFDGSRHE